MYYPHTVAHTPKETLFINRQPSKKKRCTTVAHTPKEILFIATLQKRNTAPPPRPRLQQ